jgi:hypothetical protein
MSGQFFQSISIGNKNAFSHGYDAINSNSIVMLPTTSTLINKTYYKQTRSKSILSCRNLATLFATTAGSEENYFMTMLQKRIQEVKEYENKMPVIVLDCMLPRQVLRIQANDDLLLEVVRHQMLKENPTFGMLGTVAFNAWEKTHLKTGVEVEIVQKPNFVLGKGVMLELKAKRRFVITGDDVKITKQGWSEANVEFLNSHDQEQHELSRSMEGKMSLLRAIAKAKEFTESNSKLRNNSSMVDRWIELAKSVEQKPGQIDRLLEDIGKIPPENEPSERAFWVGALINPLPSMGVAMEIRPALLTATTAERRVEVASDAIMKSIKHMEGKERMW